MRFTTTLERLGRWSMASALIAVAGCGGGGEETAAPDSAATAAAPKESVPTVKGLGEKARDRQGDMDSQAGGAAPQPAVNPGEVQRQAMMKGMASGGNTGGTAEREGPPATGSGAAVPGEVAQAAPGGGGYVPGYAAGGQSGSQGGAPPGVNYGAPAAGPAGGQAAAMMPPGGYGGPAGGFPGGGGTNSVLLGETAFLENGEALNSQEGQSGQAGFPGGEPGFGGPAGGGEQAANDFSEPTKAVESFLSAVKAKDSERIGQAISRRAPEQAKPAGLKRILTAAVGRKLESEDVEAMAETFADYQIVNVTPGKTSGSLNVTIGRERKGTGKADRIQYERRIMRVHRDGTTGWKILDFGNRIVQ